MKTILLACDRSGMDGALRRSLALLVQSCQIEIAHDGFQVFEELSRKAFDLVIIDFEVPGTDSLELVESVGYIDPGVPVILMLQQEHKTLWNTARHLKAHPIIRPFKPLPFLRLIDKLLHQHLNRYRQLAGTLKAVLDTLCHDTGGVCALLVDEAGQVLIASGEIEGLSPEELGVWLAEAAPAADLPSEAPAYVLPARSPVMQHYSLHLAHVLEGLHLALLTPPFANAARTTALWCEVDVAASQLKTTLYQQTPALSANSRPEADFDPTAAPLHRLISLQLSPAPPSPEAVPGRTAEDGQDEEADKAAVNWAILSDSPDLISRLRDFCQLG